MNRMILSCFKKALHTSASVVVLLAATNSRAADTDVYLNRSPQVLPNVMFSIDTSGSMTTRLMAAPDFEHGQNYSGAFDEENFYISVNGRIPLSPNGFSYAPLSSLEGCDFGSKAVTEDGYTGVRMAVSFSNDADVTVTKKRWVPAARASFSIDEESQINIECSDDSGVHGRSDSSDRTFAVSGNTLYAETDTNELDWSKYDFVSIFSGNYLNYKSNPPASVSLTRFHLQKRVIEEALKRTPDIKAGLVEIYGRGGRVLQGLKPSSDRQNQADFLVRLANARAWYGTPLSGSMLEVLHYYYGKPIFTYGSPDISVVDSNGDYISPITSSCQKNYVIMVTDGFPFRDSIANPVFTAANGGYPDYEDIIGQTDCEGNCLDEMTRYLSQADASPLANKYDLDGDGESDPQTIKVYPVGMELREALLDSAAASAGTRSYYAADAEEFENAFVDILATIKQSGGLSMVTAASSNDRFSKTSNREYLYYGQFVPSNKATWRGNLKKYRFAYNDDGVAYITDSSTDDPDISTSEGSIVSTAQSYWSTAVDGNDALAGGVVDRLKAMRSNNRTVYGIHNWNNEDENFHAAGNLIDGVDDEFMISEMNISDREADEQSNILNYVIGQDVKDEDGDGNTTEQRGSMGAIVRSSPLPIQFGGTSKKPEVVVFALTTDGLLHAFDDKNGDELWAVTLPEFYSEFSKQYDNFFSTTPWWGIDGSMTARVVDKNQDGIIGNNDKVYLYISGGLSQRRWYIIDVSEANADSPKITLVKRGEYDATEDDWKELGIATSPMVPLNYRLSGDAEGKVRRAMIYANGWDPDGEFSYGESSMGRGLSLYDADDGSVLWTKTHADKTALKYSFPTQPTVVDLDSDGLTDLIYAIDVNANIWRFNVNNDPQNTTSMITGGKFAELGADVDGSRRRAYKRIDAAVVQSANGVRVMLAVGTGDRMNPLSDTDDDRLYVISDTTAGSGKDPDKVLKHSVDFYNATANTLGEGSDEDKATALETLTSRAGWFINLPDGQKAISAPLISAGIVNFPVYKVGRDSADPCLSGDVGSGLLYRMNVLDATPVSDYNEDDTVTRADRFTEIRGQGIPGDVGFHTSAEGVKTILVNMDPFINRPALKDPNKPAAPEKDFQADSAGYWFENPSN